MSGQIGDPVTLVDQMMVQQDIGGPEPVYKRVVLKFWSDGSVTWETPVGAPRYFEVNVKQHQNDASTDNDHFEPDLP